MANNITDSQSSDGYGNTLVAVFDNYSDAKNAADALTSAGYNAQDVRLNPQEESSNSSTTTSDDSNQSGGIGGFFRSLFGGDENREDHGVYAESVRRGHYVLAFDAKSDDELDRASDIINQYNPVDIDERSSAWKQQGWQGYDASAPRFTQDEIARDRSNLQNEARIPVVEEEIKVGKRELQRGGVRVLKRVQEKPVNESVQLRDEHIKVERRPVSQDASHVGSDAFKEESFELRESSEEAVVSKTARVVEEVVVGKEVSQHTENIQDSVRRTDVDIEQLDGSDLREGAMNMSDDNDFRGHWQSNFGSDGGRYEDYAPAYSYGSTLAGNDGYRDRRWEEIEPQARRDWEASHPGSNWDRVKDAVRYGAERPSTSRRM